MTHASRQTNTGEIFEKQVSTNIPKGAIDITKHKLYRYLESNGIQWNQYISKKLYPDGGYVDEANNKVMIYEKKFQQTEGSADEKPQTCGFKIYEFKKLFAPLGITDVNYHYLLSSWFAQPQYEDMRNYINSVDGCSYEIIASTSKEE